MFNMSVSEWLTKTLLLPKPDPRTDAYPLMSSWTPTVLISLTYVIGVYAWRTECLKKQGKQPKNKEEFQRNNDQSSSWDFLKCLMVLYNVSMVIYSCVITFGTLWAVWCLGYGLGCEEQPDPTHEKFNSLLFLAYLFYFSKFVEMLDTVFFLWRGKVDQVTFLHVFHHASMPPSIWWGVKYAPGGITYMFPLANSFIHIVMYTYYGLAAAGAYRYLWWKNYLTLAQMIQFVILILHQGQIFVRSAPCNYPKVFPAVIVLYASLFLGLFSNFYVKAYWRKQRLAKGVQQRNGRTGEKSGDQKSLTNENGSMKQSNGYASLTNHQTRLRKIEQ
ncbi:unnamed protein product [Heterobilharzia americana]|nr:unnamed protein product [Heterobilharzia americana]CAH8627173.1 unnamed protein product [Heterobilharzia americana]